MPAGVETGKLGSLLVCVNPAAAIKGQAGLCKKAAAIATSGTSTEERIAGAELAGRITNAQAVLYGLLGLRGDPGLPKELHGDVDGPGGDLAAIARAADAFSTLPTAIQEKVFPYFVVPQAGGSSWRTPGRDYTPIPRAAAARVAAAATPDCTGYGGLENGTGTTEEAFPWQGIPTSDGKAIVWYATTDNPKWEDAEATDRASALKYAAALPEIWKKLSDEFGEPRSNAAEACYHGPDGKFDVYVGEGLVLLASRFDTHALAVTMPYPAVGDFPSSASGARIALPGSGCSQDSPIGRSHTSSCTRSSSRTGT